MSFVGDQIVIRSCYQGVVLLNVTKNSLVVAALVHWICLLDSCIYVGTCSIVAMDCSPDSERTWSILRDTR